MKIRALMALAALGMATACGGAPFAERDPSGHAACSEWSGYVSEGDIVSIVGGSMVVADLARKSSTSEIRQSVTNLLDQDTAETAGDQFGKLDRVRFEAACEAEGFTFTEPD